MTEASAPQSDPPVAQVFFCDDVRYELSNKITLVGIYSHTLFASGGAAPMPKLVAFLSFLYPVSMVGLVCEVSLQDREKTLLSTQVPLIAPRASAKIRDDQPDDRLGSLNVPIELLGFVPKNGMTLRVRLAVGDFKFESHGLLIVAPDPVVATGDAAAH